jgi:hypothetical protein
MLTPGVGFSDEASGGGADESITHPPVQDPTELAAIVSTSPIPYVDKMLCNVEDSGLYRFDAESTVVPDGFDVVIPDDIIHPAPGRWIRMTGVPPVGAPVPTKTNKAMTPSATSGDEADSGLTIAYTPPADGYVQVLVNGVQHELGDAVKTADCYFSADAGATAKGIEAIAAGDSLFWNGVIAGFDLDAGDSLDFNYDKTP